MGIILINALPKNPRLTIFEVDYSPVNLGFIGQEQMIQDSPPQDQLLPVLILLYLRLKNWE
ncbi:MAG: hypothetical protein EAZ60_15340 [Oscillatoriales cyanobacterium]|nr:MAG: hypothetical protein EAZ83_29710 [Oscillatoriales cyanobacterium]TAE96387.1 MAG: hypothetical protein EAZ79_14925 [Oscillatoriales cyanobacterium]TAF14021.1 MAG: hypothetical protein EAZ73_29520 [Oscillatoriales cyanobacterium]TAF31151.1 MAG: hypothetical protein EAZ69_20440 [Oscillatoriales cyanobacterium]TAF54812.1 MAG: hypothetical protein EAZ60_15340 [Oscillatoriales cyanobacterium]